MNEYDEIDNDRERADKEEYWQQQQGTCIHFPDDPNAVCSLCNPRKPVVDAWDAVPCEAKYPGSCVDCDGSIYIGEIIVKGLDGWAHENCRANG